MTKILTASLMALALATASMSISTEAFAKGGKTTFKSGGKHHGHHGKYRKHGKVIDVTFDNDDDDNDCKWVRTRKGYVKVCNDDDDDD
jgi:hypothetical protein